MAEIVEFGQSSSTDVLTLVYHFACRSGRLDCAKALVQAGCSMVVVDQNCMTGLMWAAPQAGHARVVEWLYIM